VTASAVVLLKTSIRRAEDLMSISGKTVVAGRATIRHKRRLYLKARKETSEIKKNEPKEI